MIMLFVQFQLFLLFALYSCIAFAQPEIKSVQLNENTQMDFALVPSGKFIMGSPEDEKDRDKDESPQREVEITKAFYFGVYEVTQKEWLAVMGTNPSIFQGAEENLNNPVDMVSWNDCIEFITILNRKGLGKFRLPTEAEWEYSCRASTTTRFHWGDDNDYKELYQYGWFNPMSTAMPHPVGEKKPNQWGLYDMIGNVWEWCSDWKGDYNELENVDPQGPKEGTLKIFRSGSWFNLPHTLRAANRNAHLPNEGYTNIGLRLVLEIEE